MSATFACPHCGATYPVKPVLVGKAVRCTKCRNGFRLRPDGVADPLPSEPAAAAPAAPAATATPAEPVAPAAAKAAAAPATPAPAPASAPPRPAPAPVAAARAAASPAAPEARGGAVAPRGRMTQQQEEARRAMAGTLSSAAAAVLKEAAPEPAGSSEAPKAASRRMAVPASSKIKSNKDAAAGPVLIVGAGERDPQRARVFWGWCAAIVVGVVLLIVAATWRGAPHRALDAYVAPVADADGHYPLRLPSMQRRAWLSGVRALVDLGSVHVGSVTHLPVAAARPVLAKIHGLRYDYTLHLYVPDAKGAPVTLKRQWKAKRSREDNIAAVQQAGLAVVDGDTLASQMIAAGISSDAADLILLLLHPTHGEPQDDAARVAAGELPDAFETASFSGTHGTELRDKGGKYSFPDVSYRGRLLHFVGQDWDRAWRVLELTTLE